MQTNSQYHRVNDSIQNCEVNIQRNRELYTQAVKEYNSVCLSIPAIFVARFLGFPPAPYLQFDTSGMPQENALREFKTDDGERLNQLLGQAGSAIASAGKNLLSQAGQVGKAVTEKIKDNDGSRLPAAPQYFYVSPNGVPQGPAALEEIRAQVIAGKLPVELKIAAVGTTDWVLITQTNC